MKSEGAAIELGDAASLITQLEDGSVDLILTDPPYNLAGYSTGNIRAPWRKEINNDLAKWDQVEFNPADWVGEFKRVLKPTGTIFAFTSYNMLGKWHDAFDPVFDTFQFVVWHKTNPVPKLRRAGFLNSCELIVALWNKGHTWNFTNQKDMHNFIEAPICMGSERLKNPLHPTQKPVNVLKQLIEWGSNPGDLVFDPFMGVGSSGVAALALQRRFLGLEIDIDYFDAAKNRLETLELSRNTEEGTISASATSAKIGKKRATRSTSLISDGESRTSLPIPLVNVGVQRATPPTHPSIEGGDMREV